MATISQSGHADNRELAKRIKTWLDGKGFETKVLEGNGAYVIKARKASAVRAVFGADRALEIEVRHFDNLSGVRTTDTDLTS